MNETTATIKASKAEIAASKLVAAPIITLAGITNDDMNGMYDNTLANIESPPDCILSVNRNPINIIVVSGPTALLAFSLLATKAPQNAAKIMNRTKPIIVKSNPQETRLPIA